MPKKNRVNVTVDPVNKVLRKLTVPMIMGVLGMVIFTLADTYFVGKLGTVQIAALSFTFPVVMVINSINLGIGVGAAAVISKAVGEKEKGKVVRLATDTLILGVLIAMIIMLTWLFTITPLFRLLGADDATMPYIKQYMQIWYIGVPFVVIPMVGNNAIRALGDTKTPSIVMLVSAGVNIIFDPLLILGIGFFPAMGVRGAALTTVIARCITFVFALYVLIFREKVISLKKVRIKQILQSWKAVLFIGLPNAVARMIVPLGSGIITGLIAVYGTKAVAGYGISTKIEFFAISIIRALVAVIPVFVGQNFGAKKFDRIKKGFFSSEKFSILYGILLYALLAVFAPFIAKLFTKDAEVIDTIVLYLRIIPLCYAFLGIVQIINGAFNALQKPIKAASVNIVQMLVIYVPLAVLSSKYLGIYAIFVSLVVSYVIVGVLGHLMLNRDINKLMLTKQEE